MSTDDKILRRLRLLLKRTEEKGFTKAEAEAAMKQAAALMAKHGLQEAQVRVTDDPEGQPKVEFDPDEFVDEVCFSAKTINRFQDFMVAVAKKVAGVGAYIGYTRHNKVVRFYGREADVAVAREIYIWCLGAMERCVRAFKLDWHELNGTKLTEKSIQTKSYREGFVRGLQVSVEDELERQEAEKEPVTVRDGSTGHALVVMTTDLVAARRDALKVFQEGLGLKSGRRRRVRQDDIAFGMGHEDGKNTSVGRNVIGE